MADPITDKRLAEVRDAFDLNELHATMTSEDFAGILARLDEGDALIHRALKTHLEIRATTIAECVLESRLWAVDQFEVPSHRREMGDLVASWIEERVKP